MGEGKARPLTRWPLSGRYLTVGLTLIASLLAAGCAPSATAPTTTVESSRGATKRITAVIQGDPHTLYQKMNPSSRVPGIENLELLVNGGLVVSDDKGVLRPQLGEQVPMVENGLWEVFPDGRMETSWKLKQNTFWHDGAPFTTRDLLFTMRVVRDQDLDVLVDRNYAFIDSVEAQDDHSITVRWNRPYLDADSLFTADRAMPIPEHLLEGPYAADKTRFLELPFWTEAFIGTGPFTLREFARGSYLIVEANDHYVLGRPKVDEIEVRFIPDQNTLIANVLAGSVELTMSRGLSVEQASQIRDQWREGQMVVQFTNWLAMWPQFFNPNPVAVTDPRFRRALLHAMDRQEMADVIQLGIVPVAHAYFNPGDPAYKDVEDVIVKYEYDPRRATQILEGMGYLRGSDGQYRDPMGQKLELELRTSATRDVSNKVLLAVADYWQKAGVGVDPSITPPALARDVDYRETFPAFELAQNPNDVSQLRSYGPDPTGRVRRGRNSYRNAEQDALIERLFVTISARERVPLLRQIVQHMTDQATVLGIFYGADPFLVGSRLANVGPGNQNTRMAWNAYAWDLR